MRSVQDDQPKQPSSREGAAKGRADADLGDALRRAYDETLNESVPDDLLDLLKKLD